MREIGQLNLNTMLKARMNSQRFSLVLFFALISSLSAQVPEWIWHNQNAADDEVRYFRKEFPVSGTVTKATLTISADNQVTAFLNGKKIVSNNDWAAPSRVDLTKEIKAGQNVLAAQAKNESGIAALMAKLVLTYADGKKATIVSDPTDEPPMRGLPLPPLPDSMPPTA